MIRTTKIDLPEARELLLKALKTQGRDFVYCPPGGNAQCSNVPDPDAVFANQRKTGCLVGTALKLGGVPVENAANHGVSSMTLKPYYTNVVMVYFSKAQALQDQGATWGEAYDVAEEYANSLDPVTKAGTAPPTIIWKH